MIEIGKLHFEPEVEFAGGRLSLDFVNTFCLRRGVELEFLSTPDDLLAWLRRAQLARGIELVGGDDEWSSEHGRQNLQRAIGLRTAVRALIEGAASGDYVSDEHLDVVNSLVRSSLSYRKLAWVDGRFAETVEFDNSADRWLAAIAQDAVDLLCHSDLSLLRQCECPTCIRMFYDSTKNHRRRWCVEKCGSAPKAAAYYRRKVAKQKARLSAS